MGGGGEHQGRGGGGGGEMQDGRGGRAWAAEHEYQQRHHDSAPADAEKSGGKAHQRADAQVGGPSAHAPSTWPTTSAKPAPALARVMYFGGVAMTPAKRCTLATPTEQGKKSNIGASLGESPT